MKRLDFQSEEEELTFLRQILDVIPLIINVNQLEDPEVPSTNINLWANRQLYDFTGYSKEEIDEMGFEFFTKTMHPDDMDLITASVNKLRQNQKAIHGGMMRLKPKNGDYQWFIGNMVIMEMKNGKPWRVVVCVQNLGDMNDTRAQIIQLIKENLQLKNQLRLKNLSKREKHIIKLIANGQTDKEMAEELSISPATVKTHRHNIIQKLGLKNKAGIAQFATEIGLD